MLCAGGRLPARPDPVSPRLKVPGWSTTLPRTRPPAKGATMAAPYRVGILNDMSEGPPGPGPGMERWLRLAVDDLTEEGRIDRDFEFVHSWGLGLPSGTAAAVERAFIELVEQDVLLIVGPAIGDDALVATPLAESH